MSKGQRLLAMLAMHTLGCAFMAGRPPAVCVPACLNACPPPPPAAAAATRLGRHRGAADRQGPDPGGGGVAHQEPAALHGGWVAEEGCLCGSLWGEAVGQVQAAVIGQAARWSHPPATAAHFVSRLPTWHLVLPACRGRAHLPRASCCLAPPAPARRCWARLSPQTFPLSSSQSRHHPSFPSGWGRARSW